MPEQQPPIDTPTEKWLFDNFRETVPQWLMAYSAGEKPTFATALSGRFVYYPGSGDDGEPVRIFNQSHSAHVFLYVDYGVSRERLETQLRDGYFTGYHSLGRIEFKAEDIAKVDFVPHVDLSRISRWGKELQRRVTAGVKPFCMMDILERDQDRNDSFGAERLAVIFLCGDGIASYDAMFGSKVYHAPFAIILHDHGFGGNYDKFGRGGLLEECAVNTDSFPELLLTASNTEVWRGYDRIGGLAPAVAGQTHARHVLYRRDRKK